MIDLIDTDFDDLDNAALDAIVELVKG